MCLGLPSLVTARGGCVWASRARAGSRRESGQPKVMPCYTFGELPCKSGHMGRLVIGGWRGSLRKTSALRGSPTPPRAPCPEPESTGCTARCCPVPPGSPAWPRTCLGTLYPDFLWDSGLGLCVPVTRSVTGPPLPVTRVCQPGRHHTVSAQNAQSQIREQVDLRLPEPSA